ncbi:MAG: hypothetical protein QXP53_01510 [Candidatus Pacearchaeota archaeon]
MSLDNETEGKGTKATTLGSLLGLAGFACGVALGIHLTENGAIYEIPLVEYISKNIDKYVWIGVFATPFTMIPYLLGN